MSHLNFLIFLHSNIYTLTENLARFARKNETFGCDFQALWMILNSVSEGLLLLVRQDPLKFVQIGSSWASLLATEWSLRHAKNPLFKVVYLGLPQPKKSTAAASWCHIFWMAGNPALSFYPRAKKWVLKKRCFFEKLAQKKFYFSSQVKLWAKVFEFIGAFH